MTSEWSRLVAELALDRELAASGGAIPLSKAMGLARAAVSQSHAADMRGITHEMQNMAAQTARQSQRFALETSARRARALHKSLTDQGKLPVLMAARLDAQIAGFERRLGLEAR